MQVELVATSLKHYMLAKLILIKIDSELSILCLNAFILKSS